MAQARNKKRNWFSGEARNNNRLPVQAAANVPLAYFRPLSNFFFDMDRLVDTTFRSFGLPSLSRLSDLQPFIPSIDIAANDDEYTITAEVPGMDEKDLKLAIDDDGTLTISGEKRQESNDNNRQDVQFSECSYGRFERTLVLPEDADSEAIEAKFKNGVLTITCPRDGETAQQGETRSIPINAERGGRGGERQERGSSGQQQQQHQGPRKAA